MSYIEYMIYSLKKMGQDGTKYIEILEDEIVKAGMTSSEIIKIEHYDMATRRISMSNAITSIKNISRFNWTMIFEKINNIENILTENIISGSIKAGDMVKVGVSDKKIVLEPNGCHI